MFFPDVPFLDQIDSCIDLNLFAIHGTFLKGRKREETLQTHLMRCPEQFDGLHAEINHTVESTEPEVILMQHFHHIHI